MRGTANRDTRYVTGERLCDVGKFKSRITSSDKEWVRMVKT